MSFVDLRFLIFLPTVLVLHYLLPERFRWLLLLIASYLFYMAWKPEYALLLLLITTIDFIAGMQMENSKSTHVRRVWLWVSLAGNLGILFVFKYFNFVFDSLQSFLQAMHYSQELPVLSLLLPIGISFHVFQSISYSIEVYRGRFPATRHFGKFALYVSFFPQLVAGPIERPSHLLKQIIDGPRATLYGARHGAKLIAWGFFKKLVVADNLAPAVTAVYAAPGRFTGPSLMIATAMFAYQLYGDFSGYTDIARGSAKLFGYDLMLNFDRPYAARSVADFWRRWHISLSSWLRDYLYYPLALSGKHHSQTRLYASLFATFVLIGLWHGANWTFVAMGALFGFYLTFASITETARKRMTRQIGLSAFPRIHRSLQVATTFILVSLAWVFFRTPDLHSAFFILSHMPTGFGDFYSQLNSLAGFQKVILMGTSISTLQGVTTGICGIVILESVDLVRARGIFNSYMSIVPRPMRFLLYGTFVTGILIFGQFSSSVPFIYFQF